MPHVPGIPWRGQRQAFGCSLACLAEPSRRSNRLGPRGSGLAVVAGGGSRSSFDGFLSGAEFVAGSSDPVDIDVPVEIVPDVPHRIQAWTR